MSINSNDIFLRFDNNPLSKCAVSDAATDHFKNDPKNDLKIVRQQQETP